MSHTHSIFKIIIMVSYQVANTFQQSECGGKKSNCLTAEVSPVGWGWQSIAFVCRGRCIGFFIRLLFASVRFLSIGGNELLDATVTEFV
jgi:hypothetical protein